MSQKPETLAELNSTFESWRAQHSDLPIVLSVLSLLKSLLPSDLEELENPEPWESLRRRGIQLARRRALFVAAEAAGHLSVPQKGTESQTIIEDLGVVIKEGNSLHKVRALRAMRFLATEECIPFLEEGLQDKSPWVQATALHTLLRLNLHHKKPRRVFHAFLLSTFRRGLTRESLFSLSDYSKNFFLNKGLFVSLVKEAGGIPLACICFLLWLTSTLLKTVIPIVVIAAAIAALVPLAVYMVVDMPFWVRRAFSPKVLTTRRILLAILDYSFVFLFLLEAGLFAPILVLPTFWFLHVLTVAANRFNNRFAEDLRTFNRFLLAIVTTYFATRVGERPQTVLVIDCVAATQLIWALPGLLFILASERLTIKRGVVRFVVFLRELAIRSGPKLLAALRVIGLMVRRIGYSVVITSSVFLLLTIVAYIALKFGYLPEKPLVLIRFQLSTFFFVTLRPYVDLTVGLTTLLLYSFVASLLVHLFWDELLLVGRVRFQTLASRPSHFNSMGEFIAYVIRVVKDASSPVGLRVSAVLALSQVPLANATNINQLLDLAEDEHLPSKVRDRIFQIVDNAEKRLQRGQSSALNVDMDLVNKQIDPLWSPGSLLRPNIRFGLMALLLVSVSVAVILGTLPNRQLTENIALVQLALGAAFLLYYILTLGVMNHKRKWLLIIGIGLVLVSLAYPFQWILITSSWPNIFLNFGNEFTDGKTLWDLFVPTMLFIVGAQVGHTIFLLESDVPINNTAKAATEAASPSETRVRSNTGILHYIDRRIERLRFQSFIVLRVLFLGMIVAALQSAPLQELVNLRLESMPVFVDVSESVRRLTNIPLDGRLIRIAIIHPENEDTIPFLDETFPRALDYSSEGKFVPRQVEEVYKNDDTCGGEVWIAAESGHLKAWSTLPEFCLEMPVLAGDTATFDLEALCRFREPIRLVAVVYNRTRSGEIKKRANPVNVAHEILAASPMHPRILADTISPFVRGVWSTSFKSKSQGTIVTTEE